VTVAQAVQRYLESRSKASLDPIEPVTLGKYEVFLNTQLIPWCVENGVRDIKAFEHEDTCRRFSESWRQQRRSVGEVLGLGTRQIEMQRFRTFLKTTGSKADRILGD
jgi:hypothetical protein